MVDGRHGALGAERLKGPIEATKRFNTAHAIAILFAFAGVRILFSGSLPISKN